jgi:tetratricopeptide (TPR) repeat protein
MRFAEVIWCCLLGLCNFVILRDIFTYGLRRVILRRFHRILPPAFLGIIIWFVGGIAHRLAGFHPDIASLLNWCLALVFPTLAALVLKPRRAPGHSILERAKALWQDGIPELTYRDGVICEASSQFANHPKVIEARRLIQNAIECASGSQVQPRFAKVMIASQAIALQELGLLHRVVNQFGEAKAAFVRGQQLLDQNGGDSCDDKELLTAYREILFRLGELSYVRWERSEAREFFRRSLALDARLGHDDPVGERQTNDLLNTLDKEKG